MTIHACNAVIHVDRDQLDGRMRILIDNEYLVGKALSYPADSVKIKDDLFKAVKTEAKPLCLRTGYRRRVKNAV